MEESSSLMTEEEEAELDAMVRQRRTRGLAFYGTAPPTAREELLVSHSGLAVPTSQAHSTNTQPNQRVVKQQSARLHIGWADTMGRRPTMEDEITIAGCFRGRSTEDFVAVYDGHGGRAVSEYCGAQLHKVLENKLAAGLEPTQALKEAFLQTNNLLRKDNVTGGSTAIAALFINNKCYIANAGDSRAVLLKDSLPYRLSRDHKPDDPEEEERIVKSGGSVTKAQNSKLGKTICRVNGMLAVSRALGDLFLQPFVTAEPEVRQFDVSSSGNQLLILACDGLWDVMTDEEAVQIAANEPDPEQAAVKLRDVAIVKESTDNISVVVIRLPPDGSSDNPQFPQTIGKEKPRPGQLSLKKVALTLMAFGVFLFGMFHFGEWGGGTART